MARRQSARSRLKRRIHRWLLWSIRLLEQVKEHREEKRSLRSNEGANDQMQGSSGPTNSGGSGTSAAGGRRRRRVSHAKLIRKELRKRCKGLWNKRRSSLQVVVRAQVSARTSLVSRVMEHCRRKVVGPEPGGSGVGRASESRPKCLSCGERIDNHRVEQDLKCNSCVDRLLREAHQKAPLECERCGRRMLGRVWVRPPAPNCYCTACYNYFPDEAERYFKRFKSSHGADPSKMVMNGPSPQELRRMGVIPKGWERY
jgi:hypothetical protein